MINTKDFEKAISEGTVINGSGLNATINHTKAATACFELAKKMALEFAAWLGDNERFVDSDSDATRVDELFTEFQNQNSK